MISVISIKAAPFAALPGATLSLAALRAIASALFASSFCRLTIGTRIRAGVRSSIRAAFRPAISAAIRSACAALPPVAFGSVTFRASPFGPLPVTPLAALRLSPWLFLGSGAALRRWLSRLLFSALRLSGRLFYRCFRCLVFGCRFCRCRFFSCGFFRLGGCFCFGVILRRGFASAFSTGFARALSSAFLACSAPLFAAAPRPAQAPFGLPPLRQIFSLRQPLPRFAPVYS